MDTRSIYWYRAMEKLRVPEKRCRNCETEQENGKRHSELTGYTKKRNIDISPLVKDERLRRKEYKRKYMRIWRKENREKLNAYNKEWMRRYRNKKT